MIVRHAMYLLSLYRVSHLVRVNLLRLRGFRKKEHRLEYYSRAMLEATTSNNTPVMPEFIGHRITNLVAMLAEVRIGLQVQPVFDELNRLDSLFGSLQRYEAPKKEISHERACTVVPSNGAYYCSKYFARCYCREVDAKQRGSAGG